MSDRTPCTRHARTVWMAYCPECTAWQLAVEIARRDDLGSGPDPRSAPTAHLGEITRAVAPVGAAGSLAA
jgi:hypothetical protein